MIQGILDFSEIALVSFRCLHIQVSGGQFGKHAGDIVHNVGNVFYRQLEARVQGLERLVLDFRILVSFPHGAIHIRETAFREQRQVLGEALRFFLLVAVRNGHQRIVLHELDIPYLFAGGVIYVRGVYFVVQAVFFGNGLSHASFEALDSALLGIADTHVEVRTRLPDYFVSLPPYLILHCFIDEEPVPVHIHDGYAERNGICDFFEQEHPVGHLLHSLVQSSYVTSILTLELVFVPLYVQSSLGNFCNQISQFFIQSSQGFHNGDHALSHDVVLGPGNDTHFQIAGGQFHGRIRLMLDIFNDSPERIYQFVYFINFMGFVQLDAHIPYGQLVRCFN
jgi:hypothetical protein